MKLVQRNKKIININFFKINFFDRPRLSKLMIRGFWGHLQWNILGFWGGTAFVDDLFTVAC